VPVPMSLCGAATRRRASVAQFMRPVQIFPASHVQAAIPQAQRQAVALHCADARVFAPTSQTFPLTSS